jgi:ABC-type sulfate transport system permease subunit
MQEKKQDTWVKVKNQIKKEHFIKIFLQIFTGSFLISLILLLIFSLSPFTTGLLKDIPEVLYNSDGVIVQEIQARDLNALYVFNGIENNIIMYLILIGGSG